jgi:hypothetical protein
VPHRWLVIYEPGVNNPVLHKSEDSQCGFWKRLFELNTTALGNESQSSILSNASVAWFKHLKSQ